MEPPRKSASRAWLGAAALVILISLPACGGGGTSNGPSETGTSGGVLPAQTGVVGASARGCHETREGSVDIQFTFALEDRSVIGGYGGPLDYHAHLLSPTRWSTGGTPHLVDRPNNQVFHVLVPKGEPIPPELKLAVQVVAIDAPATLASDSLTDLSGTSADSPFGPVTATFARAEGNAITITVTRPGDRFAPTMSPQGPLSATLIGDHKPVAATPEPAGEQVRFQFHGVEATAPLKLTLDDFGALAGPPTVLQVPVGICSAG